MRQMHTMALVAALGSASAAAAAQPAEYLVTNLSSLGGTVSRGNSVNDLGWIGGYSNLPGSQSRHASLWLYGHQFDLGTLGGANSSVVWPIKNDFGRVVGVSQTSTPDPLGEHWSCSAFFPAATSFGPTCLGFVWEWGQMRPLRTLGGNNSFAAGGNNRGEITGWAENAVHDPLCVAPQVLQFKPVVWGPGRNQVRQLALLPGDSSGSATAINDRGVAVGISGICDVAVGRYSARHAVMWQANGHVVDLGDLGGHSWNTPMAINERGDIVGFAAEAGTDPDNPNLRAFIWTQRGGMRDLGALPGDVYSEAHGINAQGQVVGVSCNADGACRAFLWENGVMSDLNALAAPTYASVLTTAQDIDDFGVITGRASDAQSGTSPAFVAIPAPHRRGQSNEATSSAPDRLSQQLIDRLGAASSASKQ